MPEEDKQLEQQAETPAEPKKGGGILAVIKKILKVVGILVVAFIVFLVGFSMWMDYDYARRQREQEEYRATHPDWNAAVELDFSTDDSDEPFEMEPYNDYTISGVRHLSIYDSEYNDLFFDPEPATRESLLATLHANPNITGQYAELMEWFINRLCDVYPDADLRPFQYNLQTLKIVELTKEEYLRKVLDVYSCGVYFNDENCIYVPEGYTFEPGTWDFQVIIHEFCHAMRNVWRDTDTLVLRADPDDPNSPIGFLTTPLECLNSLFAVSLFEYEERDIAYQLQSNMYLAMIESMDNYSLVDYVNHGTMYFAQKLDEAHGDNNRACGILMLIEQQRKDYYDSRDPRPQEEYYPTYHYICDLWIDAHAWEGMSDDAVTAMIDELVDIITYDVPEEYDLDVDEFYRYGREYYAEEFQVAQAA